MDDDQARNFQRSLDRIDNTLDKLAMSMDSIAESLRDINKKIRYSTVFLTSDDDIDAEYPDDIDDDELDEGDCCCGDSCDCYESPAEYGDDDELTDLPEEPEA